MRKLIECPQIENMWCSPKKRGRNKTPRPPKFARNQIAAMDFKAIQLAWNRSPGNSRRFISKMGSEQLPVGRSMKSMQFWETDQCPCCLQSNETGRHLMLCPDPRMVLRREEGVADLKEQLKGLRTHPRIRRCLIHMTRHILLGEPFLCHRLDEDLAQVAVSQLSIGKEELLRGRLVCGWQHIQHC